MRYFYYCFLFLSLTFTGCGESLTPMEFTTYINNPKNGFVKKQTANNYSFELQYLPPDYIALRYVFSGIETDFKKIKEQSDSTLNFKLTLCNLDSVLIDNKSAAYQARINYLMNSFNQHCVLLTENKDTIYPIIHHYERNANVKPCENVLFAFENRKDLNPDKIIIKAPLFAEKPLIFDIKKIKTLHVPKIQL